MSALTLITVPIGNDEDITLRAKNKLSKCSTIVAEDTRVIKELMKRLDIDYSSKNIFSFHDHSGDNSLEGILKIIENEELVYVSDAGSPVISDPALPLVKLAVENDIQINSLSGVSSVIVALELSGLPSTPFHFHGFLGRDKSKINEFSNLVSSQYGTHVFFEGVSRVEKTMDSLSTALPENQFAICRELTKTYESVLRFKGSEWNSVKADLVHKGEFVLLVHNPNKKSQSSSGAVDLANEILTKGARPKLLAKLLAELTGQSSKDIYSRLKD